MVTTKVKTKLRKPRTKFRAATKDKRTGKWYRMSGINEDSLDAAHQKVLDAINSTKLEWRCPEYEIVETTMKSVLKVSLAESEIATRANTDSISLSDLMG